MLHQKQSKKSVIVDKRIFSDKIKNLHITLLAPSLGRWRCSNFGDSAFLITFLAAVVTLLTLVPFLGVSGLVNKGATKYGIDIFKKFEARSRGLAVWLATPPPLEFENDKDRKGQILKSRSLYYSLSYIGNNNSPLKSF